MRYSLYNPSIYPIVLTPRGAVLAEPWSQVDLDGQYLWTWSPPALEVAAAAEAHPGSKYQLGLQAGTFSVDLHIGVGQHEAYVRYSWLHASLSLSKLHFLFFFCGQSLFSRHGRHSYQAWFPAIAVVQGLEPSESVETRSA